MLSKQKVKIVLFLFLLFREWEQLYCVFFYALFCFEFVASYHYHRSHMLNILEELSEGNCIHDLLHNGTTKLSSSQSMLTNTDIGKNCCK